MATAGNRQKLFAVDIISGQLGAQLDLDGLYDNGPCAPHPQYGNL